MMVNGKIIEIYVIRYKIRRRDENQVRVGRY